MRGEGATRHCATCKNDVFNLSEMSEAEAEAVLSSSSNVCIRYYHRPDGTIVATKAAPARRAKAKMAVVVAAAMAYPVAFVGIRAAVDGANSEARAKVEDEKSLRLAMGMKLSHMRRPIPAGPSKNPSKILVIGDGPANKELRRKLRRAKHRVTYSKTGKGKTGKKKYDLVITGEDLNMDASEQFGDTTVIRRRSSYTATRRAVEATLRRQAIMRRRASEQDKTK